jgi:cyclic pyranopterin phosphate synthase
MPAEGIALKRKDEILTYEEIYRIAKAFVEMGINKIRLTGGEPLVRKDLEVLVEKLKSLPGLDVLAMTTNAVLLKDKVSILKKLGLNALNISIDSLQKERFKEITLRDDLDNVLEAIDMAVKANFDSLKLNVVIIAHKNDNEILDFIEFVKNKSINVRFIEYMPFKDNQWDASSVYSYAQMKKIIETGYQLAPLPINKGDVAKDFQLVNYPATVSFITSMTDSFCSSCNRLRLMADGSIKSCLFYAPEMNLRDELRSGISDHELKQLFLSVVKQKPEAHPPMEELAKLDNRAMVEIGG